MYAKKACGKRVAKDDGPQISIDNVVTVNVHEYVDEIIDSDAKKVFENENIKVEVVDIAKEVGDTEESEDGRRALGTLKQPADAH